MLLKSSPITFSQPCSIMYPLRPNPRYTSASQIKFRQRCLGHEIVPIFSSTHSFLLATMTHMNVAANSGMGSSPPSGSSWQLWLLGLIVSAVLPFSGGRLFGLTKIKNKVEMLMEEAEDIAEVVEKVAEEVEKVSEGVAEMLPEGGKLQKAAFFLDNAAKETAKDAHLAQDVIKKIEEVEKETERIVDVVTEKYKDSQDGSSSSY